MVNIKKASVTGRMASHSANYRDWLLAKGYSEFSSNNLLGVMAHLSRWCDARRLDPAELDFEKTERFLRHRRRVGYTAFRSRRGLQVLFEFLIDIGVLRDVPIQKVEETPLTALLSVYQTYLERERRLTQTTVAQYQNVARQFLMAAAGSQARLGRLNAEHVTAFALEGNDRYSKGTAVHRIVALRSLLRFLFIQGKLSINLAQAAPTLCNRRRLSGLPKAVSLDIVEKLIRSCDRRTRQGLRDRAVLLCLSRLGLRKCEVARLDLDLVDWRGGWLDIHGKGGRRDPLPIPTEVGEAMIGYLKKRPRSGSRQVFLRHRAPYNGLSAAGVGAIVARACKQAKVNPIGSHQLRHTVATQILRQGGSLTEIAQLLRHESVDTTAIYAKVDRLALQAVARPWIGGKR
jgi:integrase/recombinase XerD